jgi:molybdopterin-guanine dinucleotide biosynthesis protein B
MSNEPQHRPYLVSLLGRSGSGKTTLLERLIPELARHSLKIAAVKHTSHGFTADRPGKDSYRFYEAGAAVVALASREHVAIFERREETGESDVPLSEILARLPDDLDIVLVEGFSWEALPRYVIVPGSEEPLAKHLDLGEVIRVVALPVAEPGAPPELDDALVEGMVSEIIARAKAARG